MGGETYPADILIRGDSIGFVGTVDPDTIQAQQYLEASGKVITPGFIDVHAHGDPLETPEFRNFLAMGVTSIVLGQDGSSPSVGSLDEWFAKIGEACPSVNITVVTGHGSIRAKVGVGKKADLLIFDPEEIRDKATFEHPHRLAQGFDWIMVDGEISRRDGKFTKSQFGKILKK